MDGRGKHAGAVVGVAVGLCVWAAWMFADRGSIALDRAPAPGVTASRTGAGRGTPDLSVEAALAEGAALPRSDVGRAPAGEAVREGLRVVVDGLAAGDAGAVIVEPPWDPAGSTLVPTVREVVGPAATVVIERVLADRSRRLRIVADGYAPHVRTLGPGLDEVRVELVRCEPVVIEFPGLAGRPGRFELAGRLDHWPVAVPVDAAGRATYRSVPDRGRLDFVLRTDPERSGNDGTVALLVGTQAFDVDRRRFRFADVRAHRVELLAPVPGELFRVSFELVPPQFAALPSKPGWSGVHGLYAPIGLESDTAGALVVDLLEGTATDVLFEGAVSGSFELAPFTVSGPGAVDLDR